MCNQTKNDGMEFQTAEEVLETGVNKRDKSIDQAKEYLMNCDMPKSGYNTHLKFKYYELDDILPFIQCACRKYDLTTHYELECSSQVISVPRSMRDSTLVPKVMAKATLEVRSLHYPEPAVYSIPAVVEMDNQSIGSAITYSRRYLYMVAFDITEEDVLDKQLGSNEAGKNQSKLKSKTPVKDGYEAKSEPQTKLSTRKPRVADKEKTLQKLKDILSNRGVPDPSDEVLYKTLIDEFTKCTITPEEFRAGKEILKERGVTGGAGSE
ncbi:MAG: hypothetical protein BZ136_09250 [Methanosphaera sp. rholeuAM74]|nr:MAG: hypothetical protein BZ136_09250 [Methanosphaera sp. rholeuAM74]